MTLSGGSVVTGSTISLNCLTSTNSNLNTSNVTYSYFKGALLLSGPANSATYSFVADVNDAGNDYQCVVTVFMENTSRTVESNNTAVVVTSKMIFKTRHDNQIQLQYCIVEPPARW